MIASEPRHSRRRSHLAYLIQPRVTISYLYSQESDVMAIFSRRENIPVAYLTATDV